MGKKKNKKKGINTMKKFIKLIPAVAMLLIATTLVSTATFAWFSMNTSVTATGMKIQAKSEAGLLISADKTDASWANTDATIYGDSVSLVPTSSNTLGTWYHNVSNSADNYAHSETYSTLGTTSGANVIVVKTADLAAGDAVAKITYEDDDASDDFDNTKDTGYYLMTKFFLKSSGDAITVNGSSNWFAINNIKISGITSSAALDASMRIGIKIGSAVKIIAPFAAAEGLTADATAKTISYSVAGTTNTTAYKGTLSANGEYDPNLNTGWTGTIPAKTTDTPLEIDIYLWFEGEDVNCKTNNIVATLDTLTIDVGFVLADTAPTYPVAP